MELWIKASTAAEVMEISKQALHKARRKGKYHSRIRPGKGGEHWEFALSSIPIEAQIRYMEKFDITNMVTKPSKSEIYIAAPEHAWRKVDKYFTLIKLAHGLKGNDLRIFIAYWNRNHPDNKTSYVRLLAARVKFARNGIVALLGKYGKRSGVSSVPKDTQSLL